MTADSPVVLVVGAASRDVVADDSRGWRLGGAVLFASLALARLGFEVRALVGADRQAAGATELDLLRQAGVAIALADLASGPVFDNVRHILFSTSDRIPITGLPRGWATGFDGLLLAPVADELGDEWASVAVGRPPPLVALGWQGLIRVLEPGGLVRPRPPLSSRLARSAHLVVLSEADVAGTTRPQDLHGLLRADAVLAWTEGANGGLLLRAEEPGGPPSARRYPAIPCDAVVDPTGAGDVFLAGMVAGRLQPALGDPVTLAAAAASLTVEGPGLLGVPDLAAVRARMTRAPSLASRRPNAVSSRERGRPSQA
jgi:hypothetical protein